MSGFQPTSNGPNVGQPQPTQSTRRQHNQQNSSNISPGFPGPALTGHGDFDIFEWHPAYQSCQKYFLDHAQYDDGVTAVAALINITLPHQWLSNPVHGSVAPSSSAASNGHSPVQNPGPGQPFAFTSFPRPPIASPAYGRNSRHGLNLVSLVPYIRRLVVTGFDREGVLHGFFGDDFRKGVCPLQECERRNYLFAAKSGGWADVKRQYDMNAQETVPFLKPPNDIGIPEIESAERTWSQWLAFEDWMVGPRAPDNFDSFSSSQNNHDGRSNRT